jgi:predicted S18 family serine protease
LRASSSLDAPDAARPILVLLFIPLKTAWCYIQPMKKILAAALLVMVFASPAFAAAKHHHHHHHHHHHQSA